MDTLENVVREMARQEAEEVIFEEVSAAMDEIRDEMAEMEERLEHDSEFTARLERLESTVFPKTNSTKENSEAPEQYVPKFIVDAEKRIGVVPRGTLVLWSGNMYVVVDGPECRQDTVNVVPLGVGMNKPIDRDEKVQTFFLI